MKRNSNGAIWQIDGRQYRFLAGYGAQLFSEEPLRLPVGHTRAIVNRVFAVFGEPKRVSWFWQAPRWETSWGIVASDHEIKAHRATIDGIKAELERL